MDIAKEVIGWLGFATSFSMLLPQVIKVIRSRDTKSLSLVMFLLTFVNALLWFTYGLIEKNMQLYIANACAMAASVIILFFIIVNLLKIKNKSKKNKVEKKSE